MKTSHIKLAIKFFYLLSVAASTVCYAQFRIDTLANLPNIGFPVCMAFPPDGSNRLFFTEKNNGRVRIIRNDTLLPTPYLTVSVTTSGEQGLLGLTFHPEYPDSPYFYIYYTRAGDRANQLVRYREVSGFATNPETLMVVPRFNASSNHNGGNIHFGPDGKLYVTIGDYAVASNAQDTSNSNKRGKIHRLNYDGTTPSDNPFPGNTIYAYGLRNSFDFHFDPVNEKWYASENGPNCNDEINLIVPGGNYGWPNDGNCTYSGDPQYKRPIYYWPTNLPAVTGITVYRGSAFPEYEGKLFVASYNDGALYSFTLNASGDSIIGEPTTVIDFNSGLNDVLIDNNGRIYLTNGTYGGTSRIFRLSPLTPPAPSLISPSDGSVNQPRRPTLAWHSSPSATSYRLQVAEDSLFTIIVFDDSTLTDTTKLLPPLNYFTTYYWNVTARNSYGASAPSATWKFTTIIAAPAVPTLESPSNDSHNVTMPLTFRWFSASRAETYRLQVSPTSDFTSLAFDDSTLTDTMTTIDSLSESTLYYWRVNAQNVGGTSLWSETWTFYTFGVVTREYAVLPKWNLVALPLKLFESRKDSLFPTAISAAFAYTPKLGYQPQDTLTNGIGYWIKFQAETTVTFTGTPVNADTIDVVEGWNLIGSISDSVQISSITTIPPNILASSFYGYDNGYAPANALLPMRGYWVKVSQNGQMILHISTVLRK